jgi:hypothetical protein
MIDTLVNLLFRCAHRRLSRPLAAVPQPGIRHEPPYVVCLECGKRFAYDDVTMKMGRPLDEGAEESAKAGLQSVKRRVISQPSRPSS